MTITRQPAPPPAPLPMPDASTLEALRGGDGDGSGGDGERPERPAARPAVRSRGGPVAAGGSAGPIARGLPTGPAARGVRESLGDQVVGGAGGATGAGGLRPGYSPDGRRMGRNDACWCGSGLKYKKCHGR